MQRPSLRRCAVPLAAALLIIVGVVQVPLSESARAWGDSGGGFLAGVGLIILTAWVLNALARLGAAAPPPPRTH